MRIANAIAIPVLSVSLLAVSCELEQETTRTDRPETAAQQLMTEFGGVNVDRAAVDQVLEISQRLTLDTRSDGILKMVSNLKQSLRARGIDSSVLDQIEDYTIGQHLPGVGEYWDHESGDISSKRSAIKADNPNAPYYACPPMDTQGKPSCVQLVDAAKKLTLAQVDPQAISKETMVELEQDPLCKDQPEEFVENAAQYLDALALAIHIFGIEVGAIRAEYALRDAGLCDNEIIDGEEIARLRGIEESVIVLRRLVGLRDFEIKPAGDDCLRIGAAGAATEARIESYIKAYVEEMKQGDDAFCADMSSVNPNVAKAYDVFTEGLRRGVKAHIATIWVGTFRNGRQWGTVNQHVVANIDECNPKDQITYTTSPLVIDFEGHGLQLTTDRVRFDLRATGQPQQVTWAGKTEGFLALDLNGDGRITSGRELFGDRSLCGSQRCADGAAALALYDTPAMGGNGDGRIDARDRIFDSLRIWIDRNQDGRSQPDELGTLRDHGIQALSVKPTYVNERLPGGTISLTLEVETDSGPLTAYDVWFDNLAAPGFANPLF